MAARLIWSHRALDELDGILNYIAKDSAKYASMVGQQMFARSDQLPSNPRQGRRVPEYEGEIEYREVFVHRWRLIYSISDELVSVVTIVHGARLLKKSDVF